jgi:Sulfatase
MPCPRDLRCPLLKLRHVFPFFAAALLSLTVSPADSRTRPNIIFILIDDLRWDEVDYPFVKIPNIQRIAREGVRFQNSFVTTPLCSPSRASYLTGSMRTNMASPTTQTTALAVTNSSLSRATARCWLRDRISGQMAHGRRRQSATGN